LSLLTEQRGRHFENFGGLTGTRLILQPDELEAWSRLSRELVSEFQPTTELERQVVAKIIDTHFRLNRLASVENNIFNFGLIDNTTDSDNEDRVEVLIAQTRAPPSCSPSPGIPRIVPPNQ
jgi:hypothetical protein